jgi:outer membrane lipoprotein carrier protein
MNALLYALFGIALLAPTPPTSPPRSAAEVVRGIQTFYQTTTDLKADFTQTYAYKVYDRKQVSKGKVYFKKPGRMRWDYQSPQARLFVADGATLWVYEPEEAQVFKRALAQSQLPVALTFMSGQGRLEDEFDAKLLPAPGADRLAVELIPRKSAADYQSLRLEVDARTFAVVRSTVVDPVGNLNTIDFAQVQTNSNLPEKGFQFTPPPGVRVIDDLGGR